MHTLQTLTGIGILTIASLTACTFAQHSFEAITVNESTPCDTLLLSVGQTLVVSLESNPSTGYSWEIANIPPQLTPADEGVYRQNQAPDHFVGASGVTTWTYNIAATGSGTLQFVYHRPWENTQPLKTWTCSLTVK